MYQCMILVCGGKYELFEGWFFFLDYNNIYLVNEYCDYYIKIYFGS